VRLLDLFCGAGGAGAGYARAGFEVVGVDLAPQRRYPFEFVQADALAYVAEHGREFDVIHASPPCQEVSSTRHLRDAQGKQGRTINLIPETRAALRATGRIYVIENVPRAPLVDPVWLCGSMFGLGIEREEGFRPLRRHRGFESNLPLVAPPDMHRAQPRPLGVYGSKNDSIPSGGQTVRSIEEGREIMGIDWMIWTELVEAIPPAYTEWIGRAILQEVDWRRLIPGRP
jgi:DNA (cytosine-5)-methyltransferase 1